MCFLLSAGCKTFADTIQAKISQSLMCNKKLLLTSFRLRIPTTRSSRILQGRTIMTRALKDNMSNSKRIDFSYGWPNPSLFPALSLNAGAHAVLTNTETARESLKYGPDEGYHPLRDQIAHWLTKFYSPEKPIPSDRLCITGGASQNLACVLQTFTDPIYTRNVFMVVPTYFLACRIFDDSGFRGRMRGIPEDDEGIDIEYLSQQIAESERISVSQGNDQPKFKTPYPWRKTYRYIIYAVPTFSNPSGQSMSLRRREQLVRIARKYDALIVTDDVYDMLLWSANPGDSGRGMYKALQPRIVDVDRFLDGGPTSEWGNAMSNGSFSKIVAPGCRTGWAEATPKLAWALSQTGSSRSGGAPSHLVASMINEMMVKGKLDEHIHNTLLPAYAKRYRRMMQSIEARLLPLGVEITKPDPNIVGGYFVWLTLPDSVKAADIEKHLLDNYNMIIITGPKFRVQGDEANETTTFAQNIRLCFTYVEYEELDIGIERLAKVLREQLDAR